MGIHQALRLLPQGVQLPLAIGPDVHDAGGGIAALAVLEDLLHQRAQAVSAGLELRLLPGLQGVEEHQVILLPVFLLRQADQVGLYLAVLFLIDSVYLLVPGIRDFLAVLGELDLGDEIPLFIPDGRQLVHAAEGGIVLGGDQVGAHAPGGDGCALDLQAVDQVLVQVVGGGDHRVREACRVQHLSRLLGEIGQVAAVQADAVEGQGDARLPHFREDPDGVGHPGFQGIVGIHQQDAGVRVHVRVGLEGGVLVRKAHDPAMGMGALHRHAEELPAEHVAGADAAADDSCPGPVGARVRPLGPAQAEFHDAVPSGGIADPGRLGGDQALMVDDVQDGGLHQLGLHDGGDDLDHRLPGEHDGALWNGIDIAGEPEGLQVLEKVRPEHAQGGQIVDVLLVEMQFLDVLDDLLQAGGDGVAAVAGVPTVEGVEDHGLVQVLVHEISLHHGELVQVCHQGEVLSVHRLLFSAVCGILRFFHHIPYGAQLQETGEQRAGRLRIIPD